MVILITIAFRRLCIEEKDKFGSARMDPFLIMIGMQWPLVHADSPRAGAEPEDPTRKRLRDRDEIYERLDE